MNTMEVAFQSWWNVLWYRIKKSIVQTFYSSYIVSDFGVLWGFIVVLILPCIFTIPDHKLFF